MEAIQSTTSKSIDVNVNVNATKPTFLAKLDEIAEFNRFGIISIGFLLVGIVGGATAGLFAFDATWKLATIVGVSMLSLTLMLAVAPMKWITRSIALALLVDVLMMIFSMLG